MNLKRSITGIVAGLVAFVMIAAGPADVEGRKPPHPIVDTGQMRCYSNSRSIDSPKPGQAFYGQDAQYQGLAPSYRDNGDGTVTDRATDLMWTQRDSGKPMTWQQALSYAESLTLGGHADWRLPNAKELQYLVDYSRSPDTTRSAAIDPVFHTTRIRNEAGQWDYPFFWTSTTHCDGPNPASGAAYISFGRALGKMHGRIMDVHGAGAQRSDPKTRGTSSWHGPQGDARRSSNYVRCVRGGSVTKRTGPPAVDRSRYPYNVKGYDSVVGLEQSGRQPGGPQRPGGGFVQRLDTNGDGKVSRSEFDGPPDRFDHHDRNRDGYLTDDEAPQRPPPGHRRPSRPRTRGR